MKRIIKLGIKTIGLYLLLVNTEVLYSDIFAQDQAAKSLVSKVELNKTYPDWIVDNFLDQLESKPHTDKELRFKATLEDFIGVKIFERAENCVDFIRQAWKRAEELHKSFTVRLELFLVCLGQGLLDLGIDQSLMQDFFIEQYLDTCFNMLQRFVKQDDFKSGVLTTHVETYKLIAATKESQGLFSSVLEMRVKASKILGEKYWFLAIPIEFFEEGYDTAIQDEQLKQKMIEGIFGSLLVWMKEFNDMRFPTSKDFGKESKKIGIPMYKLIGVHGIFKDRSKFEDALYQYAIDHGVMINLEKKVKKPEPDSRAIIRFIDKWNWLFEKIYENPSTGSEDIKTKLLQASLEWIKLFNGNEFISGLVDIKRSTFGINGRQIIGESRIFASMYEFQKELIEYAKSKGKKFKVKDSLPFIIGSDVPVRDYVVNMLTEWILKHRRLPEFEDYGLDTFNKKVGICFYSLYGVFNTTNYDYVLKQVYNRVKRNKRLKKVLDLLPKDLETSLEETLLETNSNKYSPIKHSKIDPRNLRKPLIPDHIKQDPNRTFLFLVENYIYPWVKEHRRYPRREDFKVSGGEFSIPISKSFLFGSKGLIPGFAEFIYGVIKECERLAEKEGIDISSYIENKNIKSQNREDIVPDDIIMDSKKLFSYIVVKYIYPRYKQSLKLPEKSDFDANNGIIPIDYYTIFGSSGTIFGSFKKFKERALFLCNLLKEQELSTCVDIMKQR